MVDYRVSLFVQLWVRRRWLNYFEGDLLELVSGLAEYVCIQVYPVLVLPFLKVLIEEREVFQCSQQLWAKPSAFCSGAVRCLDSKKKIRASVG